MNALADAGKNANATTAIKKNTSTSEEGAEQMTFVRIYDCASVSGCVEV